jgi:hypothetical protein
MNNVYLVQRIIKKSYPSDGKGVDSKFSFDYMGSAEFEFGTLPANLKIMRKTPAKNIIISSLTFQDKVAWFVGKQEDLNEAQNLFADQLASRNWSLKECTFIHDQYYNEQSYRKIDGWWGLKNNTGYAFFKEKNHAETWKNLVYGN